jgi:hypothetical protein
MQLAEIELPHDYVFTDEQVELLKSSVFYGGSPEFHPETEADNKNSWENYTKNTCKNYYTTFLVDISKVPLEIPFKVKRRLPNPYLPLGDIKSNHEHIAINNKVNVAVPNLGLMLIDELDYHVDICTEELARELKKGWRILAICPQPDQRRPDYILGRISKNTDNNSD